MLPYLEKHGGLIREILIGIGSKSPMSSQTFRLICNGIVYSLPLSSLASRCTICNSQSPSSYTVQSRISSDVFGDFFRILYGEQVPITAMNHSGLCSLAHELGFHSLLEECAHFDPVAPPTTEPSFDPIAAIQALDRRVSDQQSLILSLQQQLDSISPETRPIATENQTTLFGNDTLHWRQQIASLSSSDLWSADSDLGKRFLIQVFTNPNDRPALDSFLARLSPLNHPLLLPIVGFGGDPATVIWEFDDLTPASELIPELTPTDRLVVLSGIVSAFHFLEERGLPPVQVSVFLNGRREPKILNCFSALSNSFSESFAAIVRDLSVKKSDSEPEPSGGLAVFQFLEELSKQFVDSEVPVSFAQLLHSVIDLTWTDSGVDLAALRRYQTAVIPAAFFRRKVLDLAAVSTAARAEIGRLGGDLAGIRGPAPVENPIPRAAFWELRRKVSELAISVNCFLSPKGVFEFPLSDDREGIFGFLVNSQRTPFDRALLFSQSSGDCHCVLDARSRDNWSSGPQEYGWIEFELKSEVTVNFVRLKSAHRSFLKSWTIAAADPSGKMTPIYETRDDKRLDGAGKEALFAVRETTSRVFRVEKLGQNSSGTNFFRLKHVEFFSDGPEYVGGVFASLVARAGGDPHRADVLVRASAFDFRHWHTLDPPSSLCTLADKGDPWIQIEILAGTAVVTGYRLVHVQDFIFTDWTVEGSCDGGEWFTIDEQEEAESEDLVRVFAVAETPPLRFVRLLYQEESEDDTVKLRLRHFEIFGRFYEAMLT
jgi:hypothetical protein